AFARGRRVGVDVELIRSDVSFRDIAARYYSPSEQGFLRRQAPDDQPAAFFAVWTHKEAYMKGRGQGMAIPSQEFSVSVAGEGPTPVDDRACASRPGAWRTMRVEVGDGCAAAVAVEGRMGEFRCFEAASALAAQLSP